MTKGQLEIIARTIEIVHPDTKITVTEMHDGNFEVMVMRPVKAGVLRVIENNCSNNAAILRLVYAVKEAEELAEQMHGHDGDINTP